MTTSNTATAAPVTVAPDLKVSEATQETNDTSTATGESSLLKDFQAWKAKESKSEPKTKLTALADPADLVENNVGDKAMEVSPEAAPEVRTPESIKIGDKEYKLPELEKLTKEHEVLSNKAAELENQIKTTQANIQQFLTELRSDPTMIDRLEIPREVIEQHYYETYVKPTIPLTPEQKAELYDKSLAEKREQDRLAKEQATKEYEKSEAEKLTNHHKQRWANEINKLIETNDLPKSDFVYQRAAAYIKNALANKSYEITSQEIVERVRQDVKTLHEQQLKALTAEQLEQVLGEEGIKKLREAEMKKLASSKFQNANPSTPGEAKKPEQKKKYTSPFQLLE